MKTSIVAVAITLFFISCKSDNDMKYKDNEGDTKEVKSENHVGIQNVNGNLPDTINTINISNDKKGDTTKQAGTERLK
ncbi:MAG: hypothetical protein ABIO76_11490 [Ginsengibacter sp.]